MTHHHHHEHEQEGGKLLFTVVLNFAISIAEIIGGIFANSLALNNDMPVSKSQKILDKAQKILKEKFDVHHVTLQLEHDRCDDKSVIHEENGQHI